MLDTLQQILVIITGLAGLIGTGVSTFFAIKAVIQKNKGKSLSEIWALLMEIADTAMKEAEASGKKGAEKKELAINIINASAKAAGVDIEPFTSQLSSYIDETIKLVNDLSK